MKQENGKLIPEKDDIFKTKSGDVVRVFAYNEHFDEYFIIHTNMKWGFIKGKNIGYLCKYLGRAKHPLSTIFEVEEW